MSTARDRAVCVAFRDDGLLVIGRRRDDLSYCVLPGGGIEPGEAPEDAVVRELAEETGLRCTVQRHLWTIEHHDRRAHYYLVDVEPGPVTLGGPESAAQSRNNVYAPQWLPLTELEAENLQPDSIRDLVREVASSTK